MSVVGPRPDVPGYFDSLNGDDRILLTVKPGLVSPATLEFIDEEKILAGQADPEKYNREVLIPNKVRINRLYLENYNFWGDFKIVFLAVVKIIRRFFLR